jgi:hypothetical protein
MTRIAPFVDVELLAVRALAAALVPTRVVTRLPGDLSGEVVRVTRAPGSDLDHGVTARIDVECFAATIPDVWALAGRAHDAMRTLAASAVGGQLVDTTTTISSPSRVWYSDAVQRTVATYQIELRSV